MLASRSPREAAVVVRNELRGESVRTVDVADLAEHSQAELNKIALRLNQRPRKTLNFRCPAEKQSEFVALTI